MFTKQMKLPQARDVLKSCPLSDQLAHTKRRLDGELKDNIASKRKLTVVIGPCSADDPVSMREYLHKLSLAKDSFPDLLIAARVYTSKPHSNGQGFLGTSFHLNASDKADLTAGIVRARKMMIDCLTFNLPVADELLFPDLYPYFCDLVSYWFVGARSSEDAYHRAFASGLDVCCGVKNGTDGDVNKVAESLYAVSHPSVVPCEGFQVSTDGCKFAHVVLRGGKRGDEYVNNISTQSVSLAKKLLCSLGLNDFVMADLSHCNSCKIAANQLKNAVIAASNPEVDGVMAESYLNSGVSGNSYGVSKTDDCLNFEDTLTLLNTLQQNFVDRKK